VKKELAIFISIFLVLAIGMHFKEWTSHPVDHLMALPDAGAYGLGPMHPLIFTLIIYIIIAVPRGLVKLFKKS